ncbi:Electron transfer flavoprotein subunit beta [Ensifer sp. M14]|nr:Electron transfer flavoprotein subunit beta [Ensifer sp. M14]
MVSVGPAKAEETLRTALAMGADRAILVETDDQVEPLAVAKIVKGVAEAEQPGLIIVGKQAIDDDSNQTGQMLSALLGWAQGTFASKVEIGDGKATVTRRRHLGRQERAAAGGCPSRRCPGLGNHRSCLFRHLSASDLCRQCHPDGTDDRGEEGDHRAHRLVRLGLRGRLCLGRDDRGCSQPRSFELRCRCAVVVGSSGTDVGQDHHLGRARTRLGGEVQGSHPSGCRQARCCRRCIARGGRRRLCPERLAGRPDRQGGRPRSLHRLRHLRCDPASGRHEGQ